MNVLLVLHSIQIKLLKLMCYRYTLLFEQVICRKSDLTALNLQENIFAAALK